MAVSPHTYESTDVPSTAGNTHLYFPAPVTHIAMATIPRSSNQRLVAVELL